MHYEPCSVLIPVATTDSSRLLTFMSRLWPMGGMIEEDPTRDYPDLENFARYNAFEKLNDIPTAFTWCKSIDRYADYIQYVQGLGDHRPGVVHCQFTESGHLRMVAHHEDIGVLVKCMTLPDWLMLDDHQFAVLAPTLLPIGVVNECA